MRIFTRIDSRIDRNCPHWSGIAIAITIVIFTTVSRGPNIDVTKTSASLQWVIFLIEKIIHEIICMYSILYKMFFSIIFNRPNFLVLKKAGIRSERFSKKLLWKIFNIYMVVICQKIFFQKLVTKIFFSFVTPFLLIKRGSQKSMTEMPEDASNGLKMKFGH